MQATVKNGNRTGRGFSLPELKEAGLDARTARKHGVPTDVWRMTKYEENVEQLKAAVKSIKEVPRKEVKQKVETPKPVAPKTAKQATRKRAAGKKKKARQKRKTGKSRSKK